MGRSAGAAGPGSGMRRLLGIQYLRALAALAVVAVHACDRRGLPFSAGAAGVDVFFVISGFVIWGTSAGRTMTPGIFAWHRLVRIVPLYWAATIGLAVAALAAPSLLPHGEPSVRSVLLSLLFIPYRGANGHVSLLISGWTLTYEMFFYALFAVALLVREGWRLPMLIGSLMALVGIGIGVHPAAPAPLTYTNPLLLEFAAGMLLGRLWQRARLPGPRIGVAMLALGVALFGWVMAAGIEVGAWRAVLWGVPAILVVAGVLAIEAGGSVPHWTVPARLGDASYSIYLLHPVVIGALLRLHLASGAVFIGAALVLTAAVGLASFAGFERPVGRWLNRRRGTARAGGRTPELLRSAP